MTARIDNGGPAFPQSKDTVGYTARSGMTLRDWFAGQVITGWAANPNVIVRPASSPQAAYEVADAMIAARQEVSA